MNRTDTFLDSIFAVFEEELPEEVVMRTRQAMLDYVGVTLAGRAAQKEKLASLIDNFAEEGMIFPIGINKPLGLTDAAFINGLNAHALDFDDGTNAGIIHLGSPVFSVLFTIAQRHHIISERFIKAAAIGYETEFTMARSIQPQAKKRGYHATGICGVLGAAVAAAYAIGMSREEIKEVFSIAAVSATGTLKVLEDGSDLKPYNVAKTAMLAVTALAMARAGFRGADDVLSGNAGYLSQMYGTDEIEFMPAKLDGTYAVQKAYIKPYAACRYCHPSIDIALEMYGDDALRAEDIESVSIRTYDLAVKKHDHTVIRGSASAKMSIPYNFAVTCLTGKTGMDAFADEVVTDPAVLGLAAKVDVQEDAYMTEVFPGLTLASVEVKDKNGRVFTGQSELPKGEPENPLSQKEAEAKFTDLALYGGMSAEDAAVLARAVMEGEEPEIIIQLTLKNIADK